MTLDLYRDAHVGLRARLGELAARIHDRESEITDAFWDTLSSEDRQRLADLRRGFELVRADIFENMVRAEAMLSSYLAELETFIAKLPAIEADWAELPDGVAPPESLPESSW